jgi:hypothetical protein
MVGDADVPRPGAPVSLTFDTRRRVPHPTHVLFFSRRLAALVLTALVAVGNVAICDGWAPTDEARMACCTGDHPCPMHQGDDEDEPGLESPLTQAQADSCCAFAEQEQSGQSYELFASPISVAVLGTGVVVPAMPPRLMLTDDWRTRLPSPSPPVPTHVLLSVFLI